LGKNKYYNRNNRSDKNEALPMELKRLLLIGLCLKGIVVVAIMLLIGGHYILSEI